jgi:hypothetical protein
MKKFSALVLLLALAACAGSDKPEESKKEVAETKPAAQKIKTDNLICPQVAILQEAEEVSDYGGEEPDPAQLVAKARMKSIDGDCGYRKDGIDITFTLHMAAARGPRLGGAQVSLPYFIVVVDPAENILNRQIVTASFQFTGSAAIIDSLEPLHVFIPLPETALQAGPYYRVLVGFQLPKNKAKAD